MPILITFAIAVNDDQLFENNFLRSPCVQEPHPHQILVQKGFSSAAKAYNDAIDRSVNDLIVFCHQDIFLPAAWHAQLQHGLDQLEREDPNWGVVGVGGITQAGQGQGHLYSSGLGVIGTPFDQPAPIQTLDEIVLILRKSSGLRFDDTLPHFHLYGTDICLRAAKRGRKSYVISAFCVHNTMQSLVLPKEFYEGCSHVKRVWREFLPIQTTCVRLTRFNVPLYWRRLREFYTRHIRRRKEIVATRTKNLRKLIEEISERA